MTTPKARHQIHNYDMGTTWSRLANETSEAAADMVARLPVGVALDLAYWKADRMAREKTLFRMIMERAWDREDA